MSLGPLALHPSLVHLQIAAAVLRFLLRGDERHLALFYEEVRGLIEQLLLELHSAFVGLAIAGCILITIIWHITALYSSTIWKVEEKFLSCRIFSGLCLITDLYQSAISALL